MATRSWRCIRRADRVLLGFLAVGLVLNTGLLTEIALYSRNTLPHKPHWVLGKALMQRTPTATVECQGSRNLLARNRLNPAAWHGYQELLFSRVVDLEKATFRFRLTSKAYVTVEWKKTVQGFSGVRLSRNPDYPSLIFRADREGRFLEQRPLDLPRDRSWHSCVVRPGALQFDGLLEVAAPELGTGPGLFGLRGSLLPSEVDDLELWEGGQRILAEGFRNAANYGRMALAMGLLLLGGTVGVALLARRDRLKWAFLAHLATGLALLAFLAVDYVWYSPLFSYYEHSEDVRRRVAEALWGRIDPIPPPDLSTVPQFMQIPQVAPPSYKCLQLHLPDGTNTFLNDTPEEIEAYRVQHPKPAQTVLFLGSSQTWGEGAALLEDGMIWHAAALLPGVEVVNAARQGTNSPELAERYESWLKRFQPDLIVVNLGHNDGREMLEAGLERMAGWKVPLLFVLEGNSPENPPGARPFLDQKHAVMRSVAQKHGIPLVDLHEYLRTQANTGLLWWDFVHPTSYGHRLAGEFLGQAVKQRLEAGHQQEHPGQRQGQ